MIFHSFSSQEERRSFGGSAFIEMQFCRFPLETKKKKIVKDVNYWELDSLYIDDIETFDTNYSYFIRLFVPQFVRIQVFAA